MGGDDPSDDIISKVGGGVFQAVLIVNTHHVETGIYTQVLCKHIAAPLNTDRYFRYNFFLIFLKNIFGLIIVGTSAVSVSKSW